MDNTEHRITTLEVEMKTINDWVDKHDAFHEKLLDRSYKKQWGLWLLGLSLLGTALINLLKDWL